MGDARVGLLSESGTGDPSFQYDGAWLAGTRSPPLSRSLPPGPDPIRAGAVQAFFAGLLPEGGIRRQVAANLGLSEGNDFALLAALGGDCAGALRLLPDTEKEQPQEPPSPMDGNALARRLRDLPRHPLLAGEKGMRLSLAGAQSKLPIRLIQGSYALSSSRFPSTHILKPDSPDYPGLAAVEAFCLDLAARAGLAAVKSELLFPGGIPCLHVMRYDRETVEGSSDVSRIHQEDLCQSLGLPPHRKYQQEGGPSAADAIACIRAWSTSPVLDLRHFLDLLVFNVLIGNANAHGKNFSWVYRGGERRLAPAYDLVSTALWPELSVRLAMRVGQAKTINEVTLRHFLKFAEANRIGVPGFRSRIRGLCEAVDACLGPALGNATHLSPAFRDKLRQDIRQRSRKLSAG
jgi:serine/threonine-protein kinase HipA